MKKFDEKATGLVVGVFTGGMHLLWSLVVAFGLAQVFMDWIYGLHFMNNPFVITPFSFGQMVFLVIVTFVFGYLGGWVFAVVWNNLHSRQK